MSVCKSSHGVIAEVETWFSLAVRDIVVRWLICFRICCCLVLIIDDAQKDVDKKIVMEFTFVQPVMSVRLRMDRYINTHTHAHCL